MQSLILPKRAYTHTHRDGVIQQVQSLQGVILVLEFKAICSHKRYVTGDDPKTRMTLLQAHSITDAQCHARTYAVK